MPLDTVARAASDGVEAFDRDGIRAARGTIDAPLLAELHRHPFLSQPLPKSTGREDFGREFVYPLLTRFDDRKDDLLATLTRFSAEAIARSYRETLPAMPDEVYISGGGALNPTLMRHLVELLAPIPVAEPGRAGRRPRGQGGDRLRRARQPDAVRRRRQRPRRHRRRRAARPGQAVVLVGTLGGSRAPATSSDEQSSSSLTRFFGGAARI